VAGGDSSGFTASAELYDPGTGAWTTTGSLNAAREYHTATLLPNGKVLVAGGYGTLTYLASAELYDPSSGSWTSTGSMNTARENHTAILLPNGKVLVAGGFGSSGSSGFLGNSEVYDPVTGRWTSAGVLVTAREYHTTSLLPNGKILAAGGEDSSFGPIASAEVYDLGLGFSSSWQPTLTSVPSAVSLGSDLAITGSKFRGISGGSCGNAQDSPGDSPAVQLRSLQTDQMIFLTPTSWTSNTFTSTAISGLPVGHVLATVYVNGIPSSSAIIRLDSAAILVQGTRLANGNFQLRLTYSTGTSFTAVMSSNITTALSNWTVLGSVPEVSTGQYQFTDTQASSQPRRFYRVRSP
jgi:hypothetical protein